MLLQAQGFATYAWAVELRRLALAVAFMNRFTPQVRLHLIRKGGAQLPMSTDVKPASGPGCGLGWPPGFTEHQLSRSKRRWLAPCAREFLPDTIVECRAQINFPDVIRAPTGGWKRFAVRCAAGNEAWKDVTQTPQRSAHR